MRSYPPNSHLVYRVGLLDSNFCQDIVIYPYKIREYVVSIVQHVLRHTYEVHLRSPYIHFPYTIEYDKFETIFVK